EAEPASAPASESAPAPQKRNSAVTILLVVAALVVILAAVFGVWRVMANRVVNAKVGDCVTQTTKPDASDAKLVACDNGNARHKVIGIVKNVRESDFDADPQQICKDFPEWKNVVWVGKKGGTGDAWCLEPLGP